MVMNILIYLFNRVNVFLKIFFFLMKIVFSIFFNDIIFGVEGVFDLLDIVNLLIGKICMYIYIYKILLINLGIN